MAIRNLRVVCKIIMCVSAFTEMAIIFAGYAKDATVDACHRTSDGQEHKIIWRAGPEQDTIFYLRVTAGDFVLQLIRLESLVRELQQKTFILCMADKFAVCTDRK